METAKTKQSAEERALERMGEMLISKIESITADWKKPWFCEGACTWARNIDGRLYNGMNAFMLAMLCEEKGYTLPVFSTFDRISAMNKPTKDGTKLPTVSVRKGEKSFPVFLTVFIVTDKQGNRISYDEYLRLSEEERDKYNVRPSSRVYYVFNIAQTNIEEARPEYFEKVKVSCGLKKPEPKTGEDTFTITEVEKMLANQLWHCPINQIKGDEAYYSISKDAIVVPKYEQFPCKEKFYGTLFHEMSHSTGSETRLNRLKPSSFGSAEYATEELIAEMGSALVCLKYNLMKNVKEDSLPYLKSWLNSLKEEPKFIKTVLKDAKKASDMVINRLENLDKIVNTHKVA